MTEVVPFNFEGIAFRVIEIDAEPWFFASDVARFLGYANPQEAIRTHCKGVRETLTPTSGGQQVVKIIPERDLYRLVMRSKLPAAERFEDWVVSEVLPSIRRTGQYAMPTADEETLLDDDDVSAPLHSSDLSPRDWLGLIREARLLGGRSAGRRLWQRSPLPPLEVPGASASRRAESALACVAHLLAEIGDPAHAVPAEHGCGVWNHPDTRRPHLAVAHQHPALDRLFANTEWTKGRWVETLRAVSGACTVNRTMSFGGVKSRAVWLPLEAVSAAP